MKKKLSNLSFIFATIITAMLYEWHQIMKLNFTIIGISIPTGLVLRGLLFIVIFAAIAIYETEAIFEWSLLLTIIIGFLNVGFGNWRIILTLCASDILVIMIAALSKFSRGSWSAIIAKTTFSATVALIVESILMTLVKKTDMASAVGSAIIAGFIFGVIGGIVTAIIIVLSRESSANSNYTAKHTASISSPNDRINDDIG